MSLNELPWVVQALIGGAIGYPLAVVVCWIVEWLESVVDRWLFPPCPELDELWQPTSIEDMLFMRRALAAALTENAAEPGGTPA